MSRQRVTIVDYGVGNLLSVRRSVENRGAEVLVTSDPLEIELAERLILPGVGAFPRAMMLLQELRLVESLKKFIESQRPMLAICLGMQLLMDKSYEFVETEGLSIISGEVRELSKYSTAGMKIKVPHIGWNQLLPYENSDWSNSILRGISSGSSVYFVHSFAVKVKEEQAVLSYANVGGHQIPAAISHGYTTGCQFHPEKSGAVGLKIIENFLKL